MDSLFSHAARPERDVTASGEAPPSRVARVRLPAPRDIVYNAFVGDLHLWWPSSYTGFGEGTHPFIEDGIVGEEGPDGQLRSWGEVTGEEPGSLLEFAWTLAGPADAPTRVRVEFADDGDQTVVVLTHDGWARGREGRAQYEKYADWSVILGRFAAFFGQPADSVEET
ncbi:hypothetical protein GCM10012320_25250 [Sinomonas cellulolyticus]|uniref:Activator of Hsp90 ATPase homologue 1/2-like C-terminal domain-containing protein n=2 Tax=Sinomonas TaxID=596707 RepID=A0ABM7PRX9_SINCY|nr:MULTISPECIES: SRPBCC domain-containing protein [Actinomycetes]MBL0705077.1 SRPBCC domain-containing protein [Sinomonas cellulolyticus]BCT74962.1 hypothetical protein SCMU_08040 [Corynebacterium cyclohexanicum]GHG54058.1 hypothetical protein GCM10012320_25250 [Sinomonas sp. KCTC 49339]